MADSGKSSVPKETAAQPGAGEMIDHSVLFPPMPASHSGIHQILRCLSAGTPQIRQMLLQESDVILECKVCRSLFRSVINFVDHKKKYCSAGTGPDVSSQNVKFNLQELYSRESEEAVYVEPRGMDESAAGSGSCAPKSRGKTLPRRQNSYIVLRKIPSTSQALEQQIVTPEQIITRADIDEMSIFSHQKEYTASRLIGEIAMKQVKHSRKTSVLEKRQTLHDVIKNQISNQPAEGQPGPPQAQREAAAAAPPAKSPVQRPAKSPEGCAADAPKVAAPRKSPAAADKGTDKPGGGAFGVQGQQNACKICKKRCKNWTALAWHMRIHTRPFFKCSVCQYKAVSVFNLKRHLQQTHHLSKDWVDKMLNPTQRSGKQSSSRPPPSEMPEGNIPTCNVCLKTFANRRNVMRHMEIHKRSGKEKTPTKGRPREQTQTSKEDLARMKVMQIMDEKKLMCRKCHKSLSSMRRLHQHVCNHFGLNRYRCKSCPYENSDYTQMRRHIMGKHGRQFRTIQQISGAIKSMKVGIWINFAQFEADSVESSTTSSSSSSSSKKLSVKAEISECDKEEQLKQEEEDAEEETEEGEEDNGGDPKESEEDDESAAAPEAESSDDPSDTERTNIKEEAPKVGKTASEDVPTSSTPQPSPQVTPKKNGAEAAPRDATKRQLRTSLSPKNAAAGAGQGAGEMEWGEQDKVFLEAIMDKKNICCITCNKQYQYLSSLQRHVRFHLLASDSSSTQIKSNPDAAPRKAKAIQALINVNQLKCLKCRKRFTTMSSLKRHVGRHLGYSTFKCRFCGYVSRNYTWFKQHLLSKHTDQVTRLDQLGSLISSMKAKR